MATKKSVSDKSWVTTANRFVVYLDILGFKDFVSRNSHADVYEMMTKLSNTKETINDVLSGDLEEKYRNKNLYTTSFSDSVILFSKDDSTASLDIITGCASFLIAEAMRNSIPMKGAIAHGLISVNKAHQIYFGQPLIDAYLLQEEVKYYGIISHNSIDKYLKENGDKIEKLEEDFMEVPTPLKYGKISHTNVCWFDALITHDESIAEMKIYFEEIIDNLKSITSGEPRVYIDNTMEVFNKMYKNLEKYSSQAQNKKLKK